MKLLHLSDLHLGKRVCEMSMIEDQRALLEQFVALCIEEKIDAVLIVGDIYDKSIPCIEAVTLFDSFLTSLSHHKIIVLIIGGNHDSAERLSFGENLLPSSGIYLSCVFRTPVPCITLKDAYGEICFYLLPFLKPVLVRNALQIEVQTYEQAVQAALDTISLDTSKRNILLAHQFVTGSQISGSEEMSVGGVEHVSGCLFETFDYTALGHIHRAQTAGKEHIRYCGSPLAYSLSEANAQKSVTIIELKEKGNLTISTRPIQPLRALRTLKGTYEELTLRTRYEQENTQDYLHITLTDEWEIPDAAARLRSIYPHLLRVDYDHARTHCGQVLPAAHPASNTSPITLFENFYKMQNESDLSHEQQKIIETLITQIWEDPS